MRSIQYSTTVVNVALHAGNRAARWRWRPSDSRAAVGAVSAEAAIRKLGSGSAIVANTVGGEGARLRAGLCPCEAHHLGEEEDASESRAKGPPGRDHALLQGTHLFVPHQPQSAEISCAHRFDPFDFCWKNACLPN